MVILGFVTDWLSGKVSDGVMGTIMQGIRTLCYSIDTVIYGLIIEVYNMFRQLCEGRLLKDEMLNELATRVGLILGVIMFLRVCFSVIQMILDPDKLNDKEMGASSIIKKIIITIIMLGSSTFVFSTLYDIQLYVLDSDVISKLLLPAVIMPKDKNGNDAKDKFGEILSMELLMSTYQIEEANREFSDESALNRIDMCNVTLTALQNQIYNSRSFDLGYNCLNETIQVTFNQATGKQDTFIVRFNYLLSIVAGCAVLYLILSYCFAVGIRIIQLAALEIISPMAIISYLSPKKDNMFSKWLKIYTSTYIDVFIRIAIIDFVVLIIAAFFSTTGDVTGIQLWETIGVTPGAGFLQNSFLIIVMIVALLTFGKKAPDLIKELMPASASKLGFGASFKDLVGLKAGIGALTGAGMEALHGNPIGILTGAVRGGMAGHGAKGIFSSIGAAGKRERDHRNRVREIRENGGSYTGHLLDTLGTNLGFESGAQSYERQIAREQRAIDQQKAATAATRRKSATLSKANDYKKKLEARAEDKLLHDHFEAGDVRKTMQEQLLKSQAKIKVAERSGNADSIAKAQAEYNTMLDKYRREYITRAGKNAGDPDKIVDAGMDSIFSDLETEIRLNADGAYNGLPKFERTGGFTSLKAFDDAVTSTNSNLGREIAESDSIIQGHENTITRIKNSDGYRAAQAEKPKN